MFSESVELYDLIYSQLKDYPAEAAVVATKLEELMPGLRTILDVGCGTGEHARHLAGRGYSVDGIDIEPRFVEMARTKSTGTFVCADMMTFDLGRTYDAVLCLFSSIGYVRTLDGVLAALQRFRAHLGSGGIVLVEPWFTPEAMADATVHVHTAEGDGIRVARMSHTRIEGRLSRLTFEYMVGRASGIERASEVHELGLFTVPEMEQAFSESGFDVEFDPDGLTGRGLYVGRVERR